MPVTYEWDIETIEAEGDDPEILDHHHADALAEFDPADLRAAISGALTEDHRFGFPVRTRLVLVRDVGNDVEGLVDRSWAYVAGKIVPGRFTYGEDEFGCKVPLRFQDELLRAIRE